MKKIIFVLALQCIVSSIAFAQSTFIDYRKVLNEGQAIEVKTVGATIKEKGQLQLTVALMYETNIKEDRQQSGYSLVVNTLISHQDWQFPLNGKLLIRTTKGEVFTLTQVLNEGFRFYNPANGFRDYRGKNDTKYDGYRYQYDIIGKYPIDEEALRTIIVDGIIKIRLETTGQSVECTYPETEMVYNRKTHKREPKNLFSYVMIPYYNTLIANIDPYTTF